MSLTILTGLSGVGKSTVLEEAMLLSDKDYTVINYGDKMFEISKERDLVETRDEMKEIGTETYKEIQAEAAEKIFELSKDKDVILDTHATIKTPHGYIPGLPRWSVEQLNPNKIIMLQASAEEIFERTKEDDRNREHESVEGIQQYLNIEREMSAADAVLTGAYLQIINNPDGAAKEAAEKLVKTLKA